VVLLQRKEINILKRVSFNRNVVQFYGFCLDKSAPMLVRPFNELMYVPITWLAVWHCCDAAWQRHGDPCYI
jgi:hypothetical protein